MWPWLLLIAIGGAAGAFVYYRYWRPAPVTAAKRVCIGCLSGDAAASGTTSGEAFTSAATGSRAAWAESIPAS